MLTSKQRAFLRGLANGFPPVVYVGKGGLGDTLVKETDQALTARELIKGAVLENAPATCREIACELAEQVGADVVQIVGRKFVLYRESSDREKQDYSRRLRSVK